jgi:6-phosphogluconolactonase (cycloisomerase 2 family)
MSLLTAAVPTTLGTSCLIGTPSGSGVPLAKGGTQTDLSGTGGANQVLKQTSAGGAIAVALLVAGDIPSTLNATTFSGNVSLGNNSILSGSDSDAFSINAGSALGASHGAQISLTGASFPIAPGVATIQAGSGGNIQLVDSSAAIQAQIDTNGVSVKSLTATTGNLLLKGGVHVAGGVVCDDRLQIKATTTLTNDPGAGGLYVDQALVLGNTGGSGNYLKQTSAGGTVTSGTIPFTDITGTATKAQIGTGTPTAGYYVDGGTGAWTAVPTGGSVSLGSLTAGTLGVTLALGTQSVTSQGVPNYGLNPLPTCVLTGGGVFHQPLQPTTGILTSITTAIATGTGAKRTIVDPTGRFCYVTNATDNTISQYLIGNNGSLSSITTAVATGTGPSWMDCDPTGKYLYVSNSGANTVTAFSIGATGALVAIGAAVATGTGPLGVACDPTGRFVYIVNSSAATVSMFSIGATGALTSISTAIASGTAPSSIDCDPTGKYVYVTNSTVNTVSMYSINQSTGALTSITTAIASGALPSGLFCDPTGKYVYLANFTDSTVSMYSIGSTGALTSIASAVAAGTGANAVTCDPTGKYVYCINSTAATVTLYIIGSTGALTAFGTAIATGAGPDHGSCSPDGKYLYVCNANPTNTVSQYSIGLGVNLAYLQSPSGGNIQAQINGSSLLNLGTAFGTQGDLNFGLGKFGVTGAGADCGIGQYTTDGLLYLNVPTGKSHSFLVNNVTKFNQGGTWSALNNLTALSGNLTLTGGVQAAGAVLCNDRIQVAAATTLINDPGAGGIGLSGTLSFSSGGLIQSAGNMLISANGVTNMQLNVNGPQLGLASPATTATAGFPGIPVMTGAPTGVPTLTTGFCPMVLENNAGVLYKIWFYINSSWRGVAVV